MRVEALAREQTTADLYLTYYLINTTSLHPINQSGDRYSLNTKGDTTYPNGPTLRGSAYFDHST